MLKLLGNSAELAFLGFLTKIAVLVCGSAVGVGHVMQCCVT